jgi:hypothetical protein
MVNQLVKMGAGSEVYVRTRMTIEDAIGWFSFAAYEDFVQEEQFKRSKAKNE